MKKLVVMFFVFLVIFSPATLFSLRTKRKKTCSKHTLVIENPERFYGFVSDYFFQTTNNQNDPAEVDENKFFEILNNKHLAIEMVSNLPLTQKDVDVLLPHLSIKNNEMNPEMPTIVWDLRPLEKRVFKPIRKTNNTQKNIEIKKEKKLIERHPYYCASIALVSTGICSGISGWLLHTWLSHQ